MARKKIELSETVEGMLSEDYKERFWAEYWQVRTRFEKLTAMIDSILSESSTSSRTARFSCL